MEANIVAEQPGASDSSGETGSTLPLVGSLAPSERRDQLARLFELHADGLTRSLLAAGYPDASDAVQEAFVQAVVHWRRISRYDDPVVWLRRVAINKARNRSRSRRRQTALHDRLRSSSTTGAVEQPSVDDDVVAAVAALPTQQREVVALFYFSDLSIAQIANAMNIAEGTVKSQLHAARASVARILGATS